MPVAHRHPASFRDPSGFVFESDGLIYRQVNQVYSAHYDKLMSSGLYEQLVSAKLLIGHNEVAAPVADESQWYRTLQLKQIDLWTYPYEWCFEQLKEAALLTLRIARHCIEKGMVLKDATPYNVQFTGVKPVFIDSLSFEILNEKKPWVAYHQFCTQFLFPLYIASFSGVETNRLFRAWPQGIPAKTCWNMLPLSARLRLGIWLNVYLQKSVSPGDQSRKQQNDTKFNAQKMVHLLQHLQSEVNALQRKKDKSTWSAYYDESITGGSYVNDKEAAIEQCMAGIKKESILDLGCNDGRFSQLLCSYANHVTAADVDHESICRFFDRLKKNESSNVLPIVADVADPSPSQGFALAERSSLLDRIKPGMIVALALVHHLAIGRNIPFSLLANWFAHSATTILIEWIPKEDEKVKHLLSQRDDVFDGYDTGSFELEFSRYFVISKKIEIGRSNRVLYLMEKR